MILLVSFIITAKAGTGAKIHTVFTKKQNRYTVVKDG